ncbi:MAG: chemotaxis-specific protein-glutamate methyltransferase CheB [Bacteroidetes bacterium]|nr:chemotaxis-specific protein-glutamate methyltransferase CheB [Bacteroidota bacterium]
MIKILIAEDSPTVTMILQKIFASDDECQVIGTARNGKEAVDKVKLLRPNIVTMDIRMPVMDGFDATKQIMTQSPTPILVISASVGKDDLNIAFNAIRAGALDIVEKPKGNLAMDYEYIGRDLIKKVKILSGVKVFHHVSGSVTRGRSDASFQSPRSSVASANSGRLGTRDIGQKLVYPRVTAPSRPAEVIAIASSTGGPSALLKVLKNLPETFSVPIVIVQHICEGFGQGFVDWLNKECRLRVKTAERGEVLTGGTVYVAPDGFHTLIDPGRIVRLSKSMPVNGLRPNATLMMESVAKVFGGASIGIVLTGMGRDGADGVKAIKEAGGLTYAQSQESCVVFGMPKEAIDLGVVDKILAVERMGPDLESVVQKSETEKV